MSKLIRIHEAAELVGVTRQTIKNWVDKGVIKSQYIGHAEYINKDDISFLATDIKSLFEAQKKIQEKKSEYIEIEKELNEKILELRRMLRLYPICKEAIVRKQFYISLIEFVDRSKLKKNEFEVINEILSGTNIQDIAKEFGVTFERIRQIVNSVVRKIGQLICFKDLKEENKNLKNEIKIMNEKINNINENYSSTGDNKVLSIDVNDLHLSVRASNCLRYAKIKTLGELTKYTKSELLKSRNIGVKTIEELDSVLQQHRLHFKKAKKGKDYI